MNLAGKKITVVGIGESGKSAAFFLKSKGAVVYATDCGDSEEVKSSASALKSAGINVETGKHSKDFINNSQLIIVSPGVSDESPAVKLAKKSKIEIISEIELAFRFCKGKIVAVTGTNGKSTTATLIAKIISNAGKNAVLCGNVGEAFSKKISEISKDTIVVLEVSSFQLEHIKTFKPYISIILNISQNHLDRHKDLEEYFAAKRRIYQYQRKDDYIILNYDDINLRKPTNKINPKVFFFSQKNIVKGAYAKNNRLFLNIKTPQPICNIEDFRLRQPHNIENFLAASLCAALCDVPPDVIKNTLISFEGLEHRLQFITTIKGIDFIDDSKATTVDATRAALRSMKKKVVLIAGGKDKGMDFNLAGKDIKEKVRVLILIGEAKPKIAKAFSDFTHIIEAGDMDEAVNMAGRIARQGECVLLSPMCASFDMYRNYKERGEAFKTAVRRMNEVGPRSLRNDEKDIF